MNQKGFSLLLVIVSFLILGILIIGLYTFNKKIPLKPKPTPSLSTILSPSPNNDSDIKVEIEDGDIVIVKNGERKKITDWGYNQDPTLSPDQTKVAYLSWSEESVAAKDDAVGIPEVGSFNVWIVDIEGKNPLKVTKHVNHVVRSDLHWLDNKRLLFSDGEESVKMYDNNKKTLTHLMGPITPVPACLDACGYAFKFFYSPDNKYLIRIFASQSPTRKLGILDLQTLKSTEIENPYSAVDLESVKFDTKNEMITFTAKRYYEELQDYQVTVDLKNKKLEVN